MGVTRCSQHYSRIDTAIGACATQLIMIAVRQRLFCPLVPPCSAAVWRPITMIAMLWGLFVRHSIQWFGGRWGAHGCAGAAPGWLLHRACQVIMTTAGTLWTAGNFPDDNADFNTIPDFAHALTHHLGTVIFR